MPDASNPDTPHETLRAGRRAQTFVRTPEWVVFSGISPQALALYTVLLAHVNHARDDAVVWPGMDSLTELLRFKQRKSVQRYVAELVALGAIEVERERSMRRRNIYTVHETPPDGHDGPRTLQDFYDARDATEPAGQSRRGTPVPARRGAPVPVATGTPLPQNQTNSTRRSSTRSASGAAPKQPAARRTFASGAASTRSPARADRHGKERQDELAAVDFPLDYGSELLGFNIYDYAADMHGEAPGLSGFVEDLIARELELADVDRRHPRFVLNAALKFARDGAAA